MTNAFRAAALSFACASGCLLAAPTATRAGEVTLNGRTFTLAEGFALEAVAGPPLVDRPIVADFDDRGRLYVADSSGTNDKVEKQLAEKPHRIVRLEDLDGDGRFDRRTVFADKMMFPEGTLWFDGSLYVSAPPSIWKLTDTDGDGVADERVEWFQGKTLTGCANDLHGPYLGPDGWIYWAKGAFAQQTYERQGKPPFVTRAAHLFRAGPDGTGIEPVMTGGMDNPVDVVFTPGGERIFTTTFLQTPGGGRRDGLIHAIYGGLYGKVNGVLDGHKRTGPDLMPVLVHLGPAAPCGLTRYEAETFGPDYRDNLFACCFNLQKVTRHVLTPVGATFATRDEDFLASADHDFHPTDVIEDADGSLLVIDTGGWYKLCCPSSQLHKPEVLGGIYRIRRIGSPVMKDPRGLAIALDKTAPADLALLLADARPAVRRRAIQSLAQRGAAASSAIADAVKLGRTPEGRRNAVWAATRIEGEEARAAARVALADPDESVRQVAIHSASVQLDRGAVPALIAMLGGPSPHNLRAAAEALGRIGDRSAVPNLLAAAGVPADRAIEHSLIYALIEIADPAGTEKGLSNVEPRTRRAALVALDQMDGGGLSAERLVPYLTHADSQLRETAVWIAGRHPEWGGALAGFLRDRLDADGLTSQDRLELEGQLALFSREEPIQELIGERLRNSATALDTRKMLLRAIARSPSKQFRTAWSDGVALALQGSDPDLVQEAVAACRAFPPPRGSAVAAALARLGDDPKVAPGVRLGALSALPAGPISVSPGVFAFLRDQIGGERPVADRLAAVAILAKAKLSDEQLLTLAQEAETAGPLEIDRLLSVFEQTRDEAVGMELLRSIERNPAFTSLRVEVLKPRFAKFGAGVRDGAERLYASLNTAAAGQMARLEALLPTLVDGDVVRGQAVFNSAKAACLTCHAVGYVGGKIGPDLTKIGQIRAERDLLEAIVFPSLSFVRSYEPITVATKDGKVHSGLLEGDSAAELVIATSATEKTRIPRDDVEEMRPGTVSLMPAGLDQQISRQDLADLLAFLKSRK